MFKNSLALEFYLYPLDFHIHLLLLLLLLSRFSRVLPCESPEMAAHPAPPSLGFSRQEYLSGLPFPSPMHESEKVKVKSFSRVRLLATPWTAAYHAPPSMGFSRQEYWSGVPLSLLLDPIFLHWISHHRIYIYIYSILGRMRSLGGRESIFSTPVSPVLRIGRAQTFSRHPINICWGDECRPRVTLESASSTPALSHMAACKQTGACSTVGRGWALLEGYICLAPWWYWVLNASALYHLWN